MVYVLIQILSRASGNFRMLYLQYQMDCYMAGNPKNSALDQCG